MHTREKDIYLGGVKPIRPPEPHKFRKLKDPGEFHNFIESRKVHHLEPCLAYRLGADTRARRP